MRGQDKHPATTTFTKHFIADVENGCISSFTEFYPFCLELYYYSTFKDFNTAHLA
ncbi:hypothetical protein [Chitinophaga agrisoli]|uniref:hypothetical protein n=1 Tax=Chitinophaga agrisoli TaxID=2607653 RepID=UPI00166199CB|nr:hypothetical protein [Chitinophaga agrisoli]